MTVTYATWNSLDKGSNTTLSGGNLIATQPNGGNTGVRSTVGVSSGKWYWELTCTSSGTAEAMNGVSDSSEVLNLCGQTTHGWGYWGLNGQKYNNSSGSAFGSSYTTQVIGFALDADAGTVEIFRNNASQGTITLTGVSKPYFAHSSNASGGSNLVCTANFGASAMTYSPPSGYTAGLYGISLVNTASASVGGGTSTVTLSSFTVSSTNNLLLVAVNDQANSGGSWATNVTGVTCNGVAMTKIGVQYVDTGPYGNNTSLWGLLGPTTGNIVATRTNTGDGMMIGAELLAGVDQSVAVSSIVTNSIANGTFSTPQASPSVTSPTNGWVAMSTYISIGPPAATAGTGTKLRQTVTGAEYGYLFDSNGGVTGSTSLNAVRTTTAKYAMVVAAVAVSPASSTSFTPTPMLHMVQMTGGIV